MMDVDIPYLIVTTGGTRYTLNLRTGDVMKATAAP